MNPDLGIGTPYKMFREEDVPIQWKCPFTENENDPSQNIGMTRASLKAVDTIGYYSKYLSS